jgi:hypothetical protein
MQEIITNLHMHTTYSDGTGSHADIAQAAIKSGVDVVIVTDHNILVIGPEGYFTMGDRKVLLLVGEELHDQARLPQKSHLLVFGADRELAHLAGNIQVLVDSIRQSRGVSFIAHPDDPESLPVGETDISWEDWQVNGIHGIELWNGFSEFKSLIRSRLHAIFYAYNPKRIASGPPAKTLARWDELLQKKQLVIAIGGSDAHALHIRLGPLKRTIFPYEWHFRAINTHLLLESPLSGNLVEDKAQIMEAFALGHCFIGYDLPASTKGFRFYANGITGNATMGQRILNQGGITFQIRLPKPAECILIKDGVKIKTWTKKDICTFTTSEAGVYRVEVYLHYLGKRRGWIFSNPIFVTAKDK